MVMFWNPPKQKCESVSVGTHIQRLDPIGMFFFLPSLVSLLLALQWGGSTYSWHDPRIIALFAVFGTLLIAFAAVQILKPDTATIPPRIITQRSVISGASFTFFLAGGMLMMVYFVPMWCKCNPHVPVVQQPLTIFKSKLSNLLIQSSRVSTPYPSCLVSSYRVYCPALSPRRSGTTYRPCTSPPR